LAELNGNKIRVGGVGAYSYFEKKKKEQSFYVVKWTSLPYKVEEDTTLEDGTFLPKDELVCKAKYFDEVPRTSKKWYTPPQQNATEVVVRVRYVVAPDLQLLPISQQNKGPPRYSKEQLTELGAARLEDSDKLNIMDEIRRREVLDFDQIHDPDDSDDDEEEDPDGDDDEGLEFEQDSDSDDENSPGYAGDNDGEDNESGDEEEEEEL